MDEQVRRSVIKRKEREMQEKEEDEFAVKDQVEYVRQLWGKEREMEKKQREYQRQCAEYNLTQRAKRILKEKANIEREKKLFNEVNSMMLKRDKIKTKELAEEKLRIASTLAAIYKQQEHEKQLKVDPFFPTQKITEVPYFTLGSSKDPPKPPSRSHVARTGKARPEIRNREPYENSYNAVEGSLYEVDVIGSQRITNAYRHQSKRLYAKRDLYSEPDPLQYDKDADKFAGLRGAKFGYNIITGKGANPQSLLDNGTCLNRLPDFLRDKLHPAKTMTRCREVRYPYISRMAINNTFG